jgi:ATP-dependent helicase/nuclease subunit A
MSAASSDSVKTAADGAQAIAARPTENAWVAANAGSGKTKVLIDRVARLLLQGAEPDSILCVTYTKAAASEMQDRLFARLGGWCVMAEDRLRDALAELEGRPVGNYGPEDIGRARELFAKALETPGGLRIETIHAFCGRVLRRFPLEAGVAPGFQELDDQTTDDLWSDAFRALGALAAKAAREGERELADAVRIAAEAGAGADFGIIRALDSQRAAVQAFIRAHRGVEGASEALRLEIGAGEETVDAILERAMGADLPRAALAQALGAFRNGGKTDNTQADAIEIVLSDAPAAERFEAWRSIVLTKKGEPKKNPATKGVLAAAPIVGDLFGTDVPEGSETRRILATDKAIAARRIYERSAALLRLSEIVFANFELRKNARAGLDFDDLIHGVSRLLTRRYAAEWVLWKLDGGVAHILLDEAQDTSPHQWTILRKLTEDIFAGLGVERKSARTFFVVGDQKQSIYSFQGADPERFLSEYRDLRGRADLADVKLNAPHMAMSFRSVQQVLAYVDEVFDPAHFNGEAPFSIEPPVEADHAPHTPFRREQAGSVEFWPIEAPVKADDPDPWDAPVDQVKQTSPRMKLARSVAAWVRREIDAGTTIWEGGRQRPVQPGDFLILVKGRTGGLFDALLQSLKLQKLPVAGADRIQLLESLPVQDMLNLVRFALCPEDDLTLAEILKGPFGGLDDDALLDLAWDRQGSLWRRVRESDRADVAPPRAFLEDVLARRHDAPYEFLMRTLERPAGLEKPGWEKLLSRFGDPAREPVTALLDRAAAYDAQSPPSLELFLAAVEAHGGEVKRELSGPQNQVRVMTVHGAKGLQAPIVILPDTTSAPKLDKSGLFFPEGRKPDDPMRGAPIWVGKKEGDTPATAAMRAIADARALREHRRLLYVALTRAQDRLVICGAWTGHANAAGHDKNSWYALCRRAMDRLVDKGEALEVVDGEATRLRIGAPPPAMSAEAARRPDDAALPAWLYSDARPETATTRIVAPSSLGGDEPPANPPFGVNRARKLRRGRLIHQLFEALPDIDPRSRRKAGRDFLARQLDVEPAERAEMLDAAMDVIEDERFAAIFARGGRSEAPVIGPFGDRVVNGRVDRLVIADAEILIVDYKTDRPAPPRVQDVGEAYLAQMAAYRHILSQRWPDRPVRCLLVWTDGPKLMEIPAADLDRALKRVLA